MINRLSRKLKLPQPISPQPRPLNLKADPELLEFWKTRLLEKSDRPKIGLFWNGSRGKPMRDRYYASIEELAPVLSTNDLDFVNLQNHGRAVARCPRRNRRDHAGKVFLVAK